MRKNIDFKEKIIRDYRQRIIIDRDNPILACKASRDRYSSRQGPVVGMSYIGSNASEDALTWNVFRILYDTKKLGYLLAPYRMGRIRSLATWCFTPDIKHWNKRFQYDVGDSIRKYDGIFSGQTTEPDVIILGSTGLSIIECKLGHPYKALTHLWEGSIESINKRLPVYSKVFPTFKIYQNKDSEKYYQLIRMAFYTLILAKRYKISPHLISLTNKNNWKIKFGKFRKSPEDIWNEFCDLSQEAMPELQLHSLFWQDLINIPEVKREGRLYRYLKYHPCLK